MKISDYESGLTNLAAAKKYGVDINDRTLRSRRKEKTKYRAKIGVGNRRFSLGYFDTPEQAHAAYLEAAKKYHGEFANGG